MSISNTMSKTTYDPRWFIWTIVFLLVSGVSLASYILITSSNDANELNVFTTIAHIHHQKSVK